MEERENLRLIEQLHVGESYSKNLLKSNLLTDDTEWWAAGPQDRLPWAGGHRGLQKIAQWFQVLNAAMEYDQFEPFETVAQGDTVVVVYPAKGRARSTGRAFKSDIVRIYNFHGGKLVRVRSYYDTAAYVAALHGL